MQFVTERAFLARSFQALCLRFLCPMKLFRQAPCQQIEIAIAYYIDSDPSHLPIPTKVEEMLISFVFPIIEVR
jgi:hypothetical protein